MVAISIITSTVLVQIRILSTQFKWECCSLDISELQGEPIWPAFNYSHDEIRSPQAASEPTRKKLEDPRGERRLGNESNARNVEIRTVDWKTGRVDKFAKAR